MTLQVYTSTIWGYSPPRKNPDKLDITVKTGSLIFQPTWEMVLGFKNGSWTEDQYTRQYLALMRKKWRTYREVWNLLLRQERIVLCCYCKPGAFCHRLLLADMLVKCGAEYKGEIQNTKGNPTGWELEQAY